MTTCSKAKQEAETKKKKKTAKKKHKGRALNNDYAHTEIK